MKRTATEQAAHRAAIAAQYLRGATQADIAAALGIDRSTVSRDLAAVRAQWLAASVRDFDAQRAEELAKIDAVEREFWAAYERSKVTKEITLTEKRDGERASTHARVQREPRDGSAVYLDGVLRCIERRCRLLGLDAPERFVIHWDQLTPEQLDRLAAGEAPQRVLSA